MDISMILTIISIVIAFIGLPASFAYYPNKFPIIKKLWYILTNETFNVKISCVKEYDLFNYDLKRIKMGIHEKFDIEKINMKKNSMIISIKDMQAPYKILFLYSEDNAEKLGRTSVIITLEGNVKFNYRKIHDNSKYLNIVEDLSAIIEDGCGCRPIFKRFSLDAYTSKIEDKPFIKDYKTLICKNTKIEIDDSIKYLKINSESINNIINCLDSNITKII